jgi:hypothetical protein
MLTGLLRSSLINGVLLYAILVAGLVSAGTVLRGQLAVFIGLAIFLLSYGPDPLGNASATLPAT